MYEYEHQQRLRYIYKLKQTNKQPTNVERIALKRLPSSSLCQYLAALHREASFSLTEGDSEL